MRNEKEVCVKKDIEKMSSESFYIANNRGVAIWNGDKIEVDVVRTYEERYTKLSTTKLLLKMEFFCMKKLKGTS